MPRWREIDFAARGRFRARTRFRGHILPKTPHGVRSAFTAAAGDMCRGRLESEGRRRIASLPSRLQGVPRFGADFVGAVKGAAKGAAEGWRKRVEERREGADQGWSQVREARGSLGAVGKGSEARERGTGGARVAIGAAPEAKEDRPRRRESTDPEMRGARALGLEGRGLGAPAREGRASGPFCAAALDRAIGRLLYWGAAFVARVLRARRHAR